MKNQDQASFRMVNSDKPNMAAVMVYAERKADAQQAIKVAKAWIRSSGRGCKTVYFHEIIGTEWSSLGRRYVARIAYVVDMSAVSS
jgi:hypothetical protein